MLTWAGLNALVALVQIVVGPPAYTVLGWHDLEMAAIHRAQGFYAHPNDLGHLLGLCAAGLFGWLAVKGFRWSRAAMLLLCGASLPPLVFGLVGLAWSRPSGRGEFLGGCLQSAG